MKQLTPAQTKIVRLLALGYSNQDVAFQFNISPKTAETHRSQIYKRTGCGTIVDLVWYALREGIVTLGDNPLKVKAA